MEADRLIAVGNLLISMATAIGLVIGMWMLNGKIDELNGKFDRLDRSRRHAGDRPHGARQQRPARALMDRSHTSVSGRTRRFLPDAALF